MAGDNWVLTIWRVTNDRLVEHVTTNTEAVFNAVIMHLHITDAVHQAQGWPWELHCNHQLIADSTGFRFKPTETRPASGYGSTWGSIRG